MAIASIQRCSCVEPRLLLKGLFKSNLQFKSQFGEGRADEVQYWPHAFLQVPNPNTAHRSLILGSPLSYFGLLWHQAHAWSATCTDGPFRPFFPCDSHLGRSGLMQTTENA